MAHHTLHDVIKVIVPKGPMHHLKWFHGDADVHKMKTDLEHPRPVTMLCCERNNKSRQ